MAGREQRHQSQKPAKSASISRPSPEPTLMRTMEVVDRATSLLRAAGDDGEMEPTHESHGMYALVRCNSLSDRLCKAVILHVGI